MKIFNIWGSVFFVLGVMGIAIGFIGSMFGMDSGIGALFSVVLIGLGMIFWNVNRISELEKKAGMKK